MSTAQDCTRPSTAGPQDHRVSYSFAPQAGPGQAVVTAGTWQATCPCGWRQTCAWSPQDTSGLTTLAATPPTTNTTTLLNTHPGDSDLPT